uniref:Uncharacterized protein n=1 Tax=Arundo donax TaxID=35708 RepID=A0A0A9LIN0_ARUDO
MGLLKQWEIPHFPIYEDLINGQLKLCKSERLSGCFPYISEMSSGLLRQLHFMCNEASSSFI